MNMVSLKVMYLHVFLIYPKQRFPYCKSHGSSPDKCPVLDQALFYFLQPSGDHPHMTSHIAIPNTPRGLSSAGRVKERGSIASPNVCSFFRTFSHFLIILFRCPVLRYYDSHIIITTNTEIDPWSLGLRNKDTCLMYYSSYKATCRAPSDISRSHQHLRTAKMIYT